MIDGLEVVDMALADFGREAVVNGHHFTVIDCLTRNAALEAGFVDIDGPFVVARRDAAEAAQIRYGDEGDTMTVAGRTYTVKAIKPDALGMVLILLGAHFDE
jgi:hypothetical protein